MVWDGTHERRRAERLSRQAVEARLRELDASVQGLKRDVDALVHRPLTEPWQPARDEKKSDG
jgi:hypothetical protein